MCNQRTYPSAYVFGELSASQRRRVRRSGQGLAGQFVREGRALAYIEGEEAGNKLTPALAETIVDARMGEAIPFRVFSDPRQRPPFAHVTLG